MTTLPQARAAMNEIGADLAARFQAVRDQHPDLTDVEICILRPDLASETIMWNRCSLALAD